MHWLLVLLSLATAILFFVVGGPAFIVAGAIWMFNAGLQTSLAIAKRN